MDKPGKQQMLQQQPLQPMGVAAQRWLCDICKEKSFPDFELAVEHEKTCLGPTTITIPTGCHTNEEPVRKDNNICKLVQPKDCHLSVNGEGTSTTATAAEPLSDETKCSVVTNSFFHPRTDTQKDDQGKSTSTKKTSNKSNATGATTTINPFFAPKTKQASNTTKKSKLETSSTGKESRLSKEKEKDKPSKKSQKRKQKVPTMLTSVGVAPASVAPVSNKATSKAAKGNTGKRTSKKISSLSLTSSVERDLETTPQLASIFQHKSVKEIVAEQKQAEFQAKRHAEQQRERERQAKRSALFGNSVTETIAIGSGTTLPLKRKQHGKSTQTTLHTNHMSLPLAPRFPMPNHVYPSTDDTNKTVESTLEILPSNHVFRKNILTHQSSPSPKIQNSDVEPYRCDSFSRLDAVEACTLSPVQRIFQKFLIPRRRGDCAKTPSTKDDNRLWVDKYGMEHGLVGLAPTRTCQQLGDYFNHWRKLRREAVERMAERQRKRTAKFDKAMGNKVTSKRKPKRSKKIYGSDEDDDFLEDDDYWDHDGLGNQNSPLCLLLGPPSSGKTAMVHHVAKQSCCTVVEINTTEVRSGTALKNAIEEATKSSSLDTMLATKENREKDNFFSAKANSRVVEDSEDENNETDELRLSSMSKTDRDESSMAIVLIDEVDIVFDSEGDNGFWAALNALARTAKSPIVLTANCRPPQLRHNNSATPFCCFKMERPSPSECASKLLQICRHEGIDVHPTIKNQGAGVIQDMLIQATEACECDLRRMMNELQIFVSSKYKDGFEEVKTESVVKLTKLSASNVSNRRPCVTSLMPRQVAMDKYTVLTAKGSNFSMIGEMVDAADFDGVSASIWIGDQKCEVLVVDDKTLLVLCPPLDSEQEAGCETFSSRLVKRIIPLMIHCPSLGLFKTNTQRYIKDEALANGTSNIGSERISIEYVFPDELTSNAVRESIDNTDEFELEGLCTETDPTVLSKLNLESREDGLARLASFVQDFARGPKDSVIPTRQTTTVDDIQVASQLETYSSEAGYLSDAAFLEDFQDGVPYLSGACKGFGYDLTEECVGYAMKGDKLRLHETNRPPREEKLFEMGWKDTCYFYGDPDTWLIPLSLREGNEMRRVMSRYRGRDAVEDGLSTIPFSAIPFEELEDAEALDFNCHCLCDKSLEDSYLPQHVPVLIKALPKLLRETVSNRRMLTLGCEIWDTRLIQNKRNETMHRHMSRASYILPGIHDRTGWTYGRLGLENSNEVDELILELMPALRRIGLYEQAAEFVALEASKDGAADLGRRTTRRQAKARRHHYFDKLSASLQRDEDDLNSSELGALLANDLLQYSG
ncbi:ATPase family associated with various cellular activities AAA [Nitzschia inconspicua]|uniref:ATPase family associated with various cellular activities AAA n=1 Tax=Nitzschia inconspicua TaxID=303405 RepID=A0A9K3Q7P2_9STRA|nr:ATPase family associated with various cellular activities AAA [Nitzschia inconspicua]